MARPRQPRRSAGIQEPIARSAPRRAVCLRLCVVLVAGALTYANSLSGPFIFDDDAAVVENAQIRNVRPTVALFPHREAPTAGRPIVNLSFAINYAIGGL